MVSVTGVVEAKESGGFQPLVGFPDLDVVYESEQLFPLFSNELLYATIQAGL